MRIRIDGHTLPGPSSVSTEDLPAHERVYVAVQRRNKPAELLEPFSAGARSAHWTLDCTTTVGSQGVDVQGSYIQGGPDGRFIYLSWGEVDDGGTFTMFRRAKLYLQDVPPDVLADAERSGLLVATLGLTDEKGQPVCARVRPPAVQWVAG